MQAIREALSGSDKQLASVSSHTDLLS